MKPGHATIGGPFVDLFNAFIADMGSITAACKSVGVDRGTWRRWKEAVAKKGQTEIRLAKLSNLCQKANCWPKALCLADDACQMVERTLNADNWMRDPKRSSLFPMDREQQDFTASVGEPSVGSIEMCRLMREIDSLSSNVVHDRQRQAMCDVLKESLDTFKRIDAGEIPIAGREGGYFARLIEVIDQSHQAEDIKSYIRLTELDPEKLFDDSWFHCIYEDLEERVKASRLAIEYIFLVPRLPLSDSFIEFIALFHRFARRIRLVDQNDRRLSADILYPSIVLLQKQRIAFTHGRGQGGDLNHVSEWLFPEDYARFEARYMQIATMSRVHQAPAGSPGSRQYEPA